MRKLRYSIAGLLCVLALAVTVVSCGRGQAAAERDREIYAVALEQLFDTTVVKVLGVWDKATLSTPERLTPMDLATMRRLVPGLPEELAERYQNEPLTPLSLPDSLNSPIRYVVLETDRWGETLETSPDLAWQQLTREYGELTMITLSQIAVDSGESYAIFFFDTLCGPVRCGEGRWVVMQRQGGRWQLLRHFRY